MNKAEQFIQDYTMNCSNELAFENKDGSKLYHAWLTPADAKSAVEIAREEVIEWIDNHWREYVNVDADGVVCFGHWKNDLIKAMKDEVQESKIK